MAGNSSFEDRLTRLADKAPSEQTKAPEPRATLPWGRVVGRVVFPLVGLVALTGVIFFDGTGETDSARSGPFDLAAKLRATMTEEEITTMNNDVRINKAAAMAPTEGSAEMVRLLLSN